jgi:hypothetical protein
MGEILDFLERAFKNDGGKCCSKASKLAFSRITNSFDITEAARKTSKRYRSDRYLYHQHLEARHGAIFGIKLKLDLATGLLVRDFGFKDHALPDTGGRLTISEPGCPAQPHIRTIRCVIPRAVGLYETAPTLSRTADEMAQASLNSPGHTTLRRSSSAIRICSGQRGAIHPFSSTTRRVWIG